MKTDAFSRLFPVPKILKTNSAGFDFSSSSLKIIELSEKAGKFNIEKFGEIKFPAGSIVKGEIKERGPLKKLLIETKKKYNLNTLVASLPEEKSYIFSTTIPYVDPKEIRASIELQLEEHIPIPPEKATFDFDVVKYDSVKDELYVNIAVLPTDVVDKYIELFEEAGLDLVVLGTEADAAVASVIPKKEKGMYMIVDFGFERTGIYMVREGHVMFNATLDFGGDDITKAIMKYLNVDHQEAEKLKIEQGVAKDNKSNDLITASFSSLSVLKDEVHKYLTYWDDRMGEQSKTEKQVEKIFFCGGGSALSGLGDYLAGEFKVPFQLADPWVNVLSVGEEVPPIHHKDALKYTTSIGLALIKHNND